jgi:predicted NAD-dependent protein-ADP-ribosyltransferase YbiA (DUF1768 family)
MDQAVPPDGRILYFKRDRSEFGFLSHFHPSPILLDGRIWPTVEHYYQAQKSDQPAYREAVWSATSPGIAKRLAAPPDAPRRVSQQSWFRKNNLRPRADWPDVKLGIMRQRIAPSIPSIRSSPSGCSRLAVPS